MTHSNKIDLAAQWEMVKRIKNFQEAIESLEMEVSTLKLELTLLKFGAKNYKNFMTENFDINDYV